MVNKIYLQHSQDIYMQRLITDDFRCLVQYT